MKLYLNADSRKSNADIRRFDRRNNLRPYALHLRESALKETFSVITNLGGGGIWTGKRIN